MGAQWRSSDGTVLLVYPMRAEPSLAQEGALASFIVSFSGSATFAQLRRVASAIVTALAGVAEPWVNVEFETFDELYVPPGNLFEARWTCGTASLHERVLAGKGNPYDGFTGDPSWKLRLPEPLVTMTLHSGALGMERIRPLRWTVKAPDPATFDRVRAAIATTLGPRRDRTDREFGAVNVTAAQNLDPERARRWLERAMAGGPRATRCSWRALLDLGRHCTGRMQ